MQPHYSWRWPEECTNSMIHPTEPNTHSLTTNTATIIASLRYRKRFQKASALLKRQLRKGWFLQICTNYPKGENCSGLPQGGSLEANLAFASLYKSYKINW